MAVQRCVISPTARQCYSTLLVAAAKQKRIRQDSGKIFTDTEKVSQLVWTPNFLNGPGKWLLITASLILEKGHRIRTTVVAHQKVGQPPAGNVIRRPDILIVATQVQYSLISMCAPEKLKKPTQSEALPRSFSESDQTRGVILSMTTPSVRLLDDRTACVKKSRNRRTWWVRAPIITWSQTVLTCYLAHVTTLF